DVYIVVGNWHRRLQPRHTDVSAKIADMDAAGVKMTALSINEPGPELFGKDGPAIARLVNDFIALAWRFDSAEKASPGDLRGPGGPPHSQGYTCQHPNHECLKGNTMRYRILQSATHLGMFVLSSLTAWAQINTATVTGVVTDVTHAVIPNAEIQITSEGMGVAKTMQSNAEGQYSFTFLLPGTYNLSVKAKGFGNLERKGIVVQAAQVVTVDCELEVGAAAQAVNVIAEGQYLNLASSHQIGGVTNVEVTQLPQPRMDWATLMSLGTGMTNLGTAIAGSGTVLMNGLSPTSMSITVDGTNGSN